MNLDMEEATHQQALSIIRDLKVVIETSLLAL